jgi:hypothetical protein
MRGKTLFVLMLLAVLTVAVVAPPPARADTQTNVIIAVTAFAGAMLVLVAATYHIYGDKPHMMLPGPDPLVKKRDPRQTVEWGWQCRQANGELALACW